MLLSLPSTSDRLACLPDCFTPPEASAEPDAEPEPGPEPSAVGAQPQAGTGADAGAEPGPAPGGGNGNGGAGTAEEDLLWCTPSQLLVEVDARVRAMTGEAPPRPAGQQALLAPAPGGLAGDALLAELRVLRQEINQAWLASLPVAP